MSESKRCERCGGPLPKDDVLGGGCPRCMLELGYETRSESPKDEFTSVLPKSIGRYRILRVIGEGGMGIVYEAEQDQPRRTVALKIIKRGMSSPELLRRFELESQALGRLQHPGIAQIYEAGTVDTGFGPQPYFAMELIRGLQPLEYAELHQLDTSHRVELMVKICDAVHHAHQRGLIHRDLKPANILVDDAGQPKILDFGVVRVTDSDSRSTIETNVGQLIGTLAYMSPEQALADPLELDTRTDVYSLGVILYELLTGRLPYTISKKLHEAIQSIRDEDPAKLSAVNRLYRGDIETIVGKALEKDKTRRYQSAFGLAIDLRRYLSDEPISARPPSRSYQLRKFTRRHKTLVAGVVGVFVSLVAGVSATTWYSVHFRQEANRAGRAEKDLLSRNKELITEHQALLRANNQLIAAENQTQLEVANNKAQSLHNLWESLARASALDSASLVDDDRASLLAIQAMRINVRIPNQAHILVEDALQRAVRLNPRTHNLLDGYETEVVCVAYSLDGVHIAAGGLDGLVRVWNIQQPGTQPIIFKGHRGPVLTVAFAPDGRTIASGGGTDNTVNIWDLRNPSAPAAQFRFSLSPPNPLAPEGRVSSVAFSSNGEYLAAAGADVNPRASYTLRVWDLRKPENQPLLLYRAANVMATDPRAHTASVAFSHKGLRLASQGSDRIVRIWDLSEFAASAVLTHEFGVPSSPPPESALTNIGGFSVVFSPDDAFLASSAAGTRIWIWDLHNSGVLPRLFENKQIVKSIAFDGHRLATVGAALRLWDLEKPGTFQELKTQPAGINSVAFSPDGKYIATGSSGKTLRISEISSFDAPPTVINTPALSPQRDSVNRSISGIGPQLTIANPGTVLQTRVTMTPVFSHAGTFSTGAARFAALGLTQSIFLWDLNDPAASPIQFPTYEPVQAVAISDDGTRLAAGASDELVRVWDIRRPDSPPLVFDASVTVVKSVTFSPDGDFLAVGGALLTRLGSDINVRVWDLRHPGTPPVMLRGPSVSVNSIVFSPDGTHLAAGTSAASNNLLVWNLRHPTVSAVVPRGTGEAVTSMAFSLDGQFLAGGSADGTIRVWNFRNLKSAPLLLQGASSAINAITFSPNGRQLAFLGDTSGAMLLDLQAPRTPPILFDTPKNVSVAVFLDATHFAVANANITSGNPSDVLVSTGSVRVWPFWSAAADYLCTRVWRNLSMDEWHTYVGDDIPYERTCPALPAGAGALGTSD